MYSRAMPESAGSTRQIGSGVRAIHIAGFGHACFAATMIALGVMGLLKGGFVAIWSGVPGAIPARGALACLCAIVSLGSGIGLLVRRVAAVASSVLLGYLALWMLLFRVPLILRSPTSSGLWWPC